MIYSQLKVFKANSPYTVVEEANNYCKEYDIEIISHSICVLKDDNGGIYVLTINYHKKK